MSSDSEIVGSIAVSSDEKGVVGGIVIGEAAFLDWSGGGIEFPAQANVSGEFGSDEPLILQEAGKIVCETGRGRTHLRALRESDYRALQRGLPVVEGINAARAEGLLLEQSVPHAPQVHTKLYGVIAHDFRPGIGEIDVGFRTNPRQAGGESNQRIRKSAVDGDADNSAGDLVEIDTRDAEVCRSGFAEVSVVSFVVIPTCSGAEFRNESVREEMVVVQTDAVGVLDAGAFKITLGGTAAEAEDRRLENGGPLIAEAAGQTILIGQIGVHFRVNEIRVLVER